MCCAIGLWMAFSGVAARPAAPFVREATIVMPGVPWGPYSDYLAIDVAGRRLFATPQAAHAVAVLDLRTLSVISLISGIGNPHGIHYSEASRRLFVADGQAGAVKVFDGETFAHSATIPLDQGVNGLTYDDSSSLLYVNYGGEDAGLAYSRISVIDTRTAEKVSDIRIDAGYLEGSVLDASAHLLYVNAEDRNSVAVIDTSTRAVVAFWPLRRSTHPTAIAIDAEHRRLYVGCRDHDMTGTIAVLDTTTGKELRTLPVGGWIDALYVDPKRARIYAVSGTGHLETYARRGRSTYRRLPALDTAVMAKTGLFSPETQRMYVSVPHLGDTPAQVMVFRPTP